MHDPDISRISKQTTLIDVPHFTKISDGKRWAAVTITTKDANHHAASARTPRGDTDMPVSDAGIAAKFYLFADPVAGQARADEIEALAGSFDRLNTTEFSRRIDLCLSPP